MAYMLSIIRAYQEYEHSQWRNYNEAFRDKAATTGNWKWSVIDSHLYTTGRSSAKSTHSQFKMRVCSFFGIAGSPSLTHTFACLLATRSTCGNSKLIIEPAVTAAGVDVVAESIAADVICTAGTTVMLKGEREGGQRFCWGHPSHRHCMGWGEGHTQGGLDKVQIARDIITQF